MNRGESVTSQMPSPRCDLRNEKHCFFDFCDYLSLPDKALDRWWQLGRTIEQPIKTVPPELRNKRKTVTVKKQEKTKKTTPPGTPRTLMSRQLFDFDTNTPGSDFFFTRYP